MIAQHETMSRPLTVAEWRRVFDQEHLDSFIPQGGSSVKFLSGGPDSLASVKEDLADASRQRNFQYVELDAATLTGEGKTPDFHKIENFFFAISRTIDWNAAAKEQVLGEMQRRGIRVREGLALDNYERIAEDNGRDPQDLINEYKRIVTDRIIKDYAMARDFRVAIAALGRSQLIPDEMSPTTEQILLGWLTGEKIAGSAAALKRISIQEKISRSNAKFALISLCNWLRSVGRPGIVIVFDFRAYENVRMTKSQQAAHQSDRMREAILAGASNEQLRTLLEEPKEQASGPYYSPTAFLQALEMLRHIIDDVERLPGLALVVLGTPQFFENRIPLAKERLFTSYNALQTRIGLEVHDRSRQNPSASLVHLEAQ